MHPDQTVLVDELEEGRKMLRLSMCYPQEMRPTSRERCSQDNVATGFNKGKAQEQKLFFRKEARFRQVMYIQLVFLRA